MLDQDPNKVTERQQVVVVLRLIVSPQGQLLYGEAFEAETERGQRFSGWRGLAQVLRILIAATTQSSTRESNAPEH